MSDNGNFRVLPCRVIGITSRIDTGDGVRSNLLNFPANVVEAVQLVGIHIDGDIAWELNQQVANEFCEDDEGGPDP